MMKNGLQLEENEKTIERDAERKIIKCLIEGGKEMLMNDFQGILRQKENTDKKKKLNIKQQSQRQEQRKTKKQEHGIKYSIIHLIKPQQNKPTLASSQLISKQLLQSNIMHTRFNKIFQPVSNIQEYEDLYEYQKFIRRLLRKQLSVHRLLLQKKLSEANINQSNPSYSPDKLVYHKLCSFTLPFEQQFTYKIKQLNGKLLDQQYSMIEDKCKDDKHYKIQTTIVQWQMCNNSTAKFLSEVGRFIKKVEYEKQALKEKSLLLRDIIRQKQAIKVGDGPQNHLQIDNQINSNQNNKTIWKDKIDSKEYNLKQLEKKIDLLNQNKEIQQPDLFKKQFLNQCQHLFKQSISQILHFNINGALQKQQSNPSLQFQNHNEPINTTQSHLSQHLPLNLLPFLTSPSTSSIHKQLLNHKFKSITGKILYKYEHQMQQQKSKHLQLPAIQYQKNNIKFNMTKQFINLIELKNDNKKSKKSRRIGFFGDEDQNDMDNQTSSKRPYCDFTKYLKSFQQSQEQQNEGNRKSNIGIVTNRSKNQKNNLNISEKTKTHNYKHKDNIEKIIIKDGNYKYQISKKEEKNYHRQSNLENKQNLPSHSHLTKNNHQRVSSYLPTIYSASSHTNTDNSNNHNQDRSSLSSDQYIQQRKNPNSNSDHHKNDKMANNDYYSLIRNATENINDRKNYWINNENIKSSKDNKYDKNVRLPHKIYYQPQTQEVRPTSKYNHENNQKIHQQHQNISNQQSSINQKQINKHAENFHHYNNRQHDNSKKYFNINTFKHKNNSRIFENSYNESCSSMGSKKSSYIEHDNMQADDEWQNDQFEENKTIFNRKQTSNHQNIISKDSYISKGRKKLQIFIDRKNNRSTNKYSSSSNNVQNNQKHNYSKNIDKATINSKNIGSYNYRYGKANDNTIGRKFSTCNNLNINKDHNFNKTYNSFDLSKQKLSNNQAYCQSFHPNKHININKDSKKVLKNNNNSKKVVYYQPPSYSLSRSVASDDIVEQMPQSKSASNSRSKPSIHYYYQNPIRHKNQKNEQKQLSVRQINNDNRKNQKNQIVFITNQHLSPKKSTSSPPPTIYPLKIGHHLIIQKDKQPYLEYNCEKESIKHISTQFMMDQLKYDTDEVELVVPGLVDRECCWNQEEKDEGNEKQEADGYQGRRENKQKEQKQGQENKDKEGQQKYYEKSLQQQQTNSINPAISKKTSPTPLSIKTEKIIKILSSWHGSINKLKSQQIFSKTHKISPLTTNFQQPLISTQTRPSPPLSRQQKKLSRKLISQLSIYKFFFSDLSYQQIIQILELQKFYLTSD